MTLFTLSSFKRNELENLPACLFILHGCDLCIRVRSKLMSNIAGFISSHAFSFNASINT